MTREAGQGSGSSERMGGYDQFISLLFCVLQIIYVSYIHLCCFICIHEFISSVLSYYNMLHLLVLILQSYCLCSYLFIFNCSVNLHAYRIYMIYMIHMFCFLMIHIVMDIFEITISMINYLIYVIIIMLIYGIKMIWKMPIILTMEGVGVRCMCKVAEEHEEGLSWSSSSVFLRTLEEEDVRTKERGKCEASCYISKQFSRSIILRSTDKSVLSIMHRSTSKYMFHHKS
jgi:hypothetical protein